MPQTPFLWNEGTTCYHYYRSLASLLEIGEQSGQSHMLFAVVEKADSGFVLKPLKQKLMVDGLCYLLQEIYGIENKDADRSKVFLRRLIATTAVYE